MKLTGIMFLLITYLVSTLPAALAESASPVITTRDDWGIPSIQGNSIVDVYEEYGYVMAVDRLWQFETNRRFSRGKLAEIYGPRLVPADMQSLLMGYSEEEYQAIFETLSPRTRKLIHAYVNGVNRRVRQVLTEALFYPA